MTQDYPADLPDRAELGRGALELMERHFAALNSGNREAFRETAHLFDFVDGKPFEAWWREMSTLTPLTFSLRLDSVSDRTAIAHEPHLAIWIEVDAWSGSTRRRQRTSSLSGTCWLHGRGSSVAVSTGGCGRRDGPREESARRRPRAARSEPMLPNWPLQPTVALPRSARSGGRGRTPVRWAD